MELLVKNLLEREIERFESIPDRAEHERLLLSAARREYEIIKRLVISIDDLTGTYEEQAEKVKDKVFILVDPNEYREMVAKANKCDKIVGYVRTEE